MIENEAQKDYLQKYRHYAHLYERLPFFIAAYVVVAFIATWTFISNYIAASLIAGVPAVVGLWQWVRAARNVDRWICPRCNQGFPKRMMTRYPPKQCPHCGQQIL
jgi:hypothetical protein